MSLRESKTRFWIRSLRIRLTPVCLSHAGLEAEAAPVLQVMRRYIRTFFGCEQCGRHFEQAAAASMEKVRTREDQVLWLWNQHNRVNYRLAGTESICRSEVTTLLLTADSLNNMLTLYFLFTAPKHYGKCSSKTQSAMTDPQSQEYDKTNKMEIVLRDEHSNHNRLWSAFFKRLMKRSNSNYANVTATE